MAREPSLLDLEEAFWRAAGDRARYEERLAADAVHVFPGWGVTEREAALDAVAQAEPWEKFTIDQGRVVLLGEGAAALVYRVTAQRTGAAPYEAAITSVYRRTADGWELVVHQQTPL
jgi:ketosteroid isomerase-like protein